MFSQIAILAAVALSAAAGTVPTSVPTVATPQPTPATGLKHRGTDYTCNTGAIQCCNQVQQAGSQNGLAIIDTVLGAGVQGITGVIGQNCSPITAVGTGSGGDCAAAPICCEKNQIHGLVAIGCSPASIKA